MIISLTRYLLIFISLLTSYNGYSQSDWTLQKESDGIKVWVKDYPNSSFKQFKAITTITADINKIVSVLKDIERMDEWYDRIEHVELVQTISENEAIYILDFDLPWPVADRISAVRAKLSSNKKGTEIHIKTAYEDGIINNTEKILVDHIQSEWIIKSEGNNKVYILHKGYMDPEGSLPAWIANSGVIDGPIKTINGLQRMLPK